MLVLLSIMVAATVGLVLLEQVMLAQSAFKMAKIRQEMALAEDEHSQLLLDAARLGSSERVEQYALNTLGMVRPAPGQVRYIVAKVPTRWRHGMTADRGPSPVRGASDAVLTVGTP